MDCAWQWSAKPIKRCRINAYRQNGTYAMAIRLLPQDIPACDQLGIPRSLRHLITAKSGLLLAREQQVAVKVLPGFTGRRD